MKKRNLFYNYFSCFIIDIDNIYASYRYCDSRLACIDMSIANVCSCDSEYSNYRVISCTSNYNVFIFCCHNKIVFYLINRY